MQSHRDAAIERGMSLAHELSEILPQQAGPRLTKLYEDIQDTLRVPMVNQLFRTLANYPDYLEQAWGLARPLLRSTLFEKASDDLRAQALLRDAPSAPALKLPETADTADLPRFNDTFHYVLPKVLLTATLFYEASFGERKAISPLPAEALQTEHSGIARGTTSIPMVDPETADPMLKRLFDAIRERHGYSLVPAYYRGLGLWPEFLQQAWDRLEPHVGSDDYLAHRHTLVHLSQALVSNWPKEPVRLATAHTEDIRDILLCFQGRLIPETLLDATHLRACLEGREAAIQSRFSP